MARPKKQSLEVPEDPPASAAKYRPPRWRLASLRPSTRTCSATQRPALPHVEWTYTLE